MCYVYFVCMLWRYCEDCIICLVSDFESLGFSLLCIIIYIYVYIQSQHCRSHLKILPNFQLSPVETSWVSPIALFYACMLLETYYRMLYKLNFRIFFGQTSYMKKSSRIDSSVHAPLAKSCLYTSLSSS